MLRAWSSDASLEPYRHARLRGQGFADRVGADQKAVAVVVADHAGGAPGRELAQAPDLGDTRRNFLPRAVEDEVECRSDRHTVEPVFPDGEGEPALARRLQR